MDTVKAKTCLKTAKRVIIKVGSSLLVSPTSNGLRTNWMLALAVDIAQLRAANCQVILVSSGAVALGKNRLKLQDRPLKLEEKQALAALGQVELAKAWANVFAPHDLAIGQVLLTLDDTENRRRWLNCRSTLRTLLQMNAIPLINENDSVASDEIRYGDNDRLAARTAQMVSADLLVLLSDVDGLYTDPPTSQPAAKHIPVVHKITPEIEAMAGGTGSMVGSGGMITKLIAAQIASASACATLIADGRKNAPLQAILDGANCTLFCPQLEPLQARKNWIAGTVQPKGKLFVDAGAARALADGASLLAAGITGTNGDFERGEVVGICLQNGIELARGLVSYNAGEINRIQGIQSTDIAAILGYDARKAVVHRDDLVITGTGL